MSDDDPDLRFAELAVEQWRLIRALTRLVGHLPEDAKARTAAQARFADSRLSALVEAQGLQLATFEGRDFDPSLPVSAVNLDDFEGPEPLRICETIEPAVLRDGRVLQLARVVLEKEGVDAPRN